MKVLLLTNEPGKATRLRMFRKTLFKLGFEVYVPKITSRNWFDISTEIVHQIKDLRPDVVHVFNVPDFLYRSLPKLKDVYFRNLIYDYRSPWDLELRIRFCRGFDLIGRVYERKLARSADIITAANSPLAEKVREYNRTVDVHVVPNYPSAEELNRRDLYSYETERPLVVFLGKVSKEEGAYGLSQLITKMEDVDFWVVGDGPEIDKIPRGRNVKFFGWQPYEKALGIVEKADVCIVPRKETPATKYYTDKNLWKVNECLNLGVKVVASGIVKEEERKNLVVTRFEHLHTKLSEEVRKKPEQLTGQDYRYWEELCEPIVKKVYEEVTSLRQA
jgi:glycosyltransferase involved in cell wall biosynthesis